MLRNNYTFKYKEKNKFEMDSKYRDDDNCILQSYRPLSEKAIEKLPNKHLHKFVDSVLTSKKIGNILFSTNAEKEINLMTKSNEVMKMNMTKIASKPSIVNINPMDIFKNRNKKETIMQITKETDFFKKRRDTSKNELEKKCFDFYKKIVKENVINKRNNKDDKKYRFQRIFNNIKTKLETEQTFLNTKTCSVNSNTPKRLKLPDIHLDITDVYSRLYHNAVLITPNNESTPVTTDIILNSPDKKANLTVKNVIDSKGKEFTIKITDEILMKCFGKHSGGPNINIGKVFIYLLF
jgi:hypothetical protein